MSRTAPAPDCRDLMLPAAYTLVPPAQVALEDYARVLLQARACEVIEAEPGQVTGVHLCGPGTAVTDGLATDIAAFARELSLGGQFGLGW